MVVDWLRWCMRVMLVGEEEDQERDGTIILNRHEWMLRNYFIYYTSYHLDSITIMFIIIVLY